MLASDFELESLPRAYILRIRSADGTNRLTRSSVLSLTDAIHELSRRALPLIITGNERFFSVGADLQEIAMLGGPGAYEFAQVGQRLMNTVCALKVPVFAAVSGYCMGGGLDLA